MANLLESSSIWLNGMREKHMTSQVAYCRGGEEINCSATVGKTVFQIAREVGPFERFESRDYLITASDLVVNGDLILPERGDTILEKQEDNVYVYEVMAPGNEPCWRYSDSYRQVLRIHTKLIAKENADG